MEARYELKAPASPEDWRMYHAIRRKELYEDFGQFGVYDENHPDQWVDGNHPLQLHAGGEIIGAIRVDIRGALAVFRQVAVRGDVQRQGHGRVMMELATAFARTHGCERIELTSHPGAIGFYQRCGFAVSREPSEGVVGTLMKRDFPRES